MSKKILFTSLVLFGLLFSQIAEKCLADAASEFKQAESHRINEAYQQAEEIYKTITADYPGTSYALKAQRGLAIVYILTQRSFDARDALDKLTADFAGYSEPNAVAEALFDIARQYEWSAKYEKAKTVFQQIMDEYSNTWFINRANLAVPRTNIMGLIAWGKDDEAQAAINELVADPNFSKHPDLPPALYSFARRYGWSHKYEQAESLYLQLVQRYPDSPFASKVPLSVPATNILSLIESGKDSEAQAAIDKLIADFAGQPALPATLYGIAEKYEWTHKFEKARGLHQQITQQYPDTPQADKARLDIAKLNIIFLTESGEDNAVQTALDKLITDFNDHSALPTAVFMVGEQYYYKAVENENQGQDEQTRGHFQKAITVWERLITELPPSFPDTAHAYYFSAVCYRRLGEYEKPIEYCKKILDNWPDYKYAWSAQFQIGYIYENLEKSGSISKSRAYKKIKDAYEQLIDKYPDCEARPIAEKWLSKNAGSIQIPGDSNQL